MASKSANGTNCSRILYDRNNNRSICSQCSRSKQNPKVLSLVSIMIARDHRIAENTASDRQRLYGNTFQRSSDRQRLYGNTFQRSGDRQRSYGNYERVANLVHSHVQVLHKPTSSSQCRLLKSKSRDVQRYSDFL